jgi:hypothetical protein
MLGEGPKYALRVHWARGVSLVWKYNRKTCQMRGKSPMDFAAFRVLSGKSTLLKSLL